VDVTHEIAPHGEHLPAIDAFAFFDL